MQIGYRRTFAITLTISPIPKKFRLWMSGPLGNGALRWGGMLERKTHDSEPERIRRGPLVRTFFVVDFICKFLRCRES